LLAIIIAGGRGIPMPGGIPGHIWGIPGGKWKLPGMGMPGAIGGKPPGPGAKGAMPPGRL
jgi:hypothetical protein